MAGYTRYRGPRIRATKSPYQYPYMQYPYQNVGTQLTWRDRPPFQTRAAPASLGDLPLPGAPEVIPADSGYAGYEAMGCGGDCGCKKCGPAPMSGVLDDPLAKAVGLAGLAYVLYRVLKKR